jgi:hypothetical protein
MVKGKWQMQMQRQMAKANANANAKANGKWQMAKINYFIKININNQFSKPLNFYTSKFWTI